MRITHNWFMDTTLRNLNHTMERLAVLQGQLTSGKRINKPSDDPVSVAKALPLRSQRHANERYIQNIDAALAWLNLTEANLTQVNQLLSRGRELAVQGANASLSDNELQAIAIEVDQLLKAALDLGNARYGDQFLFGGRKTTSQPFITDSAPPGYQFLGDGGELRREIGVGVTMAINTPGEVVFPPVFDALIALRDSLQAGDRDQVAASIAAVDQAQDTILANLSQLGARVNRLEASKMALEKSLIDIADLLSKTEDLDLVEAITQYSLEENVHKAALAAGARAIRVSLLDYLD